jgi:hypothetical protein
MRHVLALALFPALACALPGGAALVVSNLKAPLRWRTHAALPESKPLPLELFLALERPEHGGRPPGCVASDAEGRRDDCLDDFADLGGRTTLVAVAVSGGGARAARLAAHALAELEARWAALAGEAPLVGAIDAFSTVSGGSLYAYHVARAVGHARLSPLRFVKPAPVQSAKDPYEPEAGSAALFRSLRDDVRVSAGTQHLGALALQSVVGASGLNLAAGPFVDWSFLDHLAKGLEASQSGRPWDLVVPPGLRAHYRMADLPAAPRFYFNATTLETGHPFVLTQRVTNARPRCRIPDEYPCRARHRPIRVPMRSARFDLHPALPGGDQPPTHDPRRPLRSGFTLEDFGGSPGNFALAYAAVASAAFPLGVEPLTVAKYVREGDRMRIYEDTVRLSDGGVYDNSGLTAVVDLYEHLVMQGRVRDLVLVAINADTTRYDANRAESDGERRGPDDFFQLGGPLASLSSGAESLGMIHTSNKRRGEDVAWARLQHLDRWLALEGVAEAERAEQAKRYDSRAERGKGLRYVHYFPVHLAQLSGDDAERVAAGEGHSRRVRDIATGYWLDFGDDARLAAATRALVTSEQPTGWNVGPECDGQNRAMVKRLDEAVAFAVARARSGDWRDPLGGAAAQDWCASPHQPVLLEPVDDGAAGEG